MKRFEKIIFIILLILPLLYAKPLDKVSLKLQWLDQFQFAGYYIAKEKGFYKDAGLEVDILKYTNNDKDIVESVLNGKATFATGRTSLLIHRDKGKKVIALAAIFQHSPSALLVTDKDITTPFDLIDKKVMISSDAITSASYMSMLFSEGISKDDIIIQKHSYNVNDLLTGKTDAIAAYISNEPFKLEKRGIPYKYFHPKDYGFDFYGDILYTSEKEYKENPHRVINFTKATLKGWEYAFENIEETAKLIYEKYNGQNKELDALIYEGQILKELAYDEKNEIGHIDKRKFEEIAKIYRLLGLIDKDYNLEEFIYDMHCMNRPLLFNKEEDKWLKENKQIRLGIDNSWQPIEFLDKNKDYSGIAAGYKKLLEEKLGIKLVLEKDAPWHEMINKFKKNEIDLFLAVVETKQRQRFMNFTSSYLQFPAVIVTKEDIGYIKDLNQLSFKTLALEEGFYTEELIRKINPDINILYVDNTNEALKAVSKGSAYAYIGTLPSIGYFIKEQRYTNLKINGEAPFETKLSFAVRKDLKTLHSILEKTLDSISQDEHDEIYNKWINIEYVHTTDYTTVAIVALLSIIVFLILYIRNSELKTISETDNLTKIANRRKIESFLELELERSERSSHLLCIVMIDIDFFKNINDTYGHHEGDFVLKQLAKILEKNTRKYDLVGRWGGEEFLIVCPYATLPQTIPLCKKLQKKVAKISTQKIKELNITISCGIAQYKKGESSEEIINRADDELYKAKNNGRNCIYPKV